MVDTVKKDRVLDVRLVDPHFRREMVLRELEALMPGRSFTLVGDRDQQPLRRRLTAEARSPFEWKDIQWGPPVWRARLTKVPPVARPGDLRPDRPRTPPDDAPVVDRTAA